MDTRAKLKTKLNIEVKQERVYEYLKNRYQDEDYKKVSKEIKGYVPEIKVLKEDGSAKLSFYVADRDALSDWKIGGWKWGYELSSREEGTCVTIWYDWSPQMLLATFGTIKYQAANEVVETVLALKALERVSIGNI